MREPFQDPSLDPWRLLAAWLVVVSASFIGYALFALGRAGVLWLLG